MSRTRQLVQTDRGRLMVIVGVALVLRLASVAEAPSVGQPFGDAVDYDRNAASLVHDGHFPTTLFAAPGSATALRPPAYPVLMAAIYWTLGRSLDAVRVVNAVLGTVAVALLYLLVAKVFDRRRARFSAGLAAVLPSLVCLPDAMLSENLFVPTVLAALLMVAMYRRDSRGLPVAAAAGFLVGAAAMSRSNGALLILPVLVGVWGGERARRWVAPILALGCMLLALAPWTVRNAVVFGKFLPLGTQSGFTMAGVWNGIAQRPGPKRAEWGFPMGVPAYADVFNRPGFDEGAIDAALRSRATSFAVHHPAIVPETLAINLGRTFGIHPGHSSLDDIAFTEMGVPKRLWPILRVSTWLLAAFAAAGLIALARDRRLWRESAWLWLASLILLFGYVVWLGTPRYRVPVDPLLAVLATFGASACCAAIAKRGSIDEPRPRWA